VGRVGLAAPPHKFFSNVALRTCSLARRMTTQRETTAASFVESLSLTLYT
jgi:hypothetical protein